MIEVPVRFVEERRFRRRSAPVLRAVHSFVKLLPIVQDTQRGRDARRNIKAGLVVTGLVFLLGGGEFPFLIPVGILLMASAIWLPLWELDRRTALTRLKQRSIGTREVEVAGRLVHDGRRLELWRDGEKQRRVLTDRAFRLETYRSEGGQELWCVRPGKGEAKREAIWMQFSGEAQGALVDADRVFELARVDGDAEALRAKLREASGGRG